MIEAFPGGTSEKITTITSHGNFDFLGKTPTKIVAKAVASATRWLARKRSWPKIGKRFKPPSSNEGGPMFDYLC